MRSFAASCLLLVALVACEGGSETEVRMDDHVFEPATLTITAGEAVTWVNESDEAHTVTAVEERFPAGADYFSSGGSASEAEANDSLPDELIEPGETFEVTLEEPGTYSYYCIPHRTDQMRGMIVVQE